MDAHTRELESLRSEVGFLRQQLNLLQPGAAGDKAFAANGTGPADSNFRTLFDHSLDVLMVVLVPSGVIQHVSESVEFELGYSTSDLVGQPFTGLFPDESGQSRQVLLELTHIYDAVLTDQSFLHKNGSVMLMDLTSTLIPWENQRAVLFSIRATRERRQAEAERAALLRELQDAMDQVKLLRGFLPICAHCKKIRDVEGFWQQIEEYIRDHSEADFSHGICPDCISRHYSDL